MKIFAPKKNFRQKIIVIPIGLKDKRWYYFFEKINFADALIYLRRS